MITTLSTTKLKKIYHMT